MRYRATALLVSKRNAPILALGKVLEDQGLQTLLVENVFEARGILQQGVLPAAVFSAAALDDGTWADVLYLADKARPPVPVIVVSRNEDINLHITALEVGAADFIVPPFGGLEIAHVLQCAIAGGVGTARHARAVGAAAA